MLEQETLASLAASLSDASVKDATNKRAHFRFAMRSMLFPVRRPDQESVTIMLKDLSRSGACGLIQEPLQADDYLVIEFDTRHRIEARVRWVRRLLVGLEFTNPLSETYLELLRDRCLEQAAAQREAQVGKQ